MNDKPYLLISLLSFMKMKYDNKIDENTLIKDKNILLLLNKLNAAP